MLRTKTHTVHQQTVGDSQPFFPMCIPLKLCPAELKVQQGKEIDMDSQIRTHSYLIPWLQ